MNQLTIKTHQQKGIAVISAMLLAALTTVIVSNMIWNQHLLVSELENQQNLTQATWVADAAVNWSRAILAEDMHMSAIDHAKEIWATKLPITPVEGGAVAGTITDMQQFFNLNNLAQEGDTHGANHLVYARLLAQLNLESNLADTLHDWLDVDELTISPHGAESDYYLAQSPAYRSANQPLVETGNLIKVKGYHKKIIDEMMPYVTVLPKNTAVNVNTASAEVLAFVIPNISIQEAQTIVANRNVTFFKDINDFKQRLPNNSIDISRVNLSVSSEYFLITCFAHYGKTVLKVESLLYRDNQAGWPQVLWKRVG